MRCPQCEFHPRPDNDYLCGHCRSDEVTPEQKRFQSFAQVKPDEAEYLLKCVHRELYQKNYEFTDSLFLQSTTKDLSDKQVAALTKMARFQAEREQQRQERTDIPEEGRITIEGEIVHTKQTFNDYGECLKLRIRDDRGFEVWGNAPKALRDKTLGLAYYDTEGVYCEEAPEIDDLKGTRVKLVATVKISSDDSTFGFFSRPKVVA